MAHLHATPSCHETAQSLVCKPVFHPCSGDWHDGHTLREAHSHENHQHIHHRGSATDLGLRPRRRGRQEHQPQLSYHPAQGHPSYAITIYDPDAPTGSGDFWLILAGIPADATSLGEGGGCRPPVREWTNDYQEEGYLAPVRLPAPLTAIHTVHAMPTEQPSTSPTRRQTSKCASPSTPPSTRRQSPEPSSSPEPSCSR